MRVRVDQTAWPPRPPHDQRQEARACANASRNEADGALRKLVELEERADPHHAEEEEDRVAVDGAERLAGGNDAERDAGNRAEQRSARAPEGQIAQAPERDEHVGGDEDDRADHRRD